MLCRYARASLALVALLSTACSGAAGAPVRSASAPVATTGPSPVASPAPVRTATAMPIRGPTFILVRSSQITAGARLNFQGQGFLPGEQAAVNVEDAQGVVEAALDPVTISKDGNLDEVSVVLPDGIGRGDHVLHVTGASSGKSGRATFTVLYVTPKITLDTYSAKSDHTFGFSGSGFTPGELVDVRLGGMGGAPLASFPSDAQGNVVAENVPLPLIQAGDYALYFVGEQSQTPVSVGFNVQGFQPWVVLDSYSVVPYSAMGFTGEDFVPGDHIEVYLGHVTGQPLFRLAVDANGQFAVRSAFNLPEPGPGEPTVDFCGSPERSPDRGQIRDSAIQPRSGAEQLRRPPGTQIAFIGSGWARNETLHAYAGEGRAEVATFQADASGAFNAAGGFRLPIGTIAGGVPLTVTGNVSHAEVTLWYQALELKPSAELTAYQGPPGTVVAFTGRSFAGGERVTVQLRERGGPELASAVASDDGTIEQVSSYPIDGNWGDDIPFVLVGDDSHAEATTDFKIANRSSRYVHRAVRRCAGLSRNRCSSA